MCVRGNCRDLKNCIYEEIPDIDVCLSCSHGIVLKNGEWVDELEHDPEDFNPVTQEYEES